MGQVMSENIEETAPKKNELSEFIANEIAARLTFEEIYGELAGSLRGFGRFRRGPCPLHALEGENFTSRDANFSVNTEKLTWECFSHCGRGDVIDYLFRTDEKLAEETARKPKSRMHIIVELAKQVGVEQELYALLERVYPDRPQLWKGKIRPVGAKVNAKADVLRREKREIKDVTHVSAPDEIVAVLTRVMHIYRSLYVGSPGEKYMQARGIWGAQDIGYCPGGRTLLDARLPEKSLLALGLIRKDGTDAFARRVVSPFTWEGFITCLHARAIDVVDANGRKHLYTRCSLEEVEKSADGKEESKREVFWTRGVYGEDALEARSVMLVEGAFDVMAARRLGFAHVVSIGGSRNQAVFERLKGAEVVLIGTDDDKTGNRVSRELRAFFGSEKIRRVSPRFGKDWAATLERKSQALGFPGLEV